MAELSGVPYTPSQIVNLGFIIMNSHHMLRSDVRKWLRKPVVDKTWANFKLHFTQAHIELRETSASANEMGSTAPMPSWTPSLIDYALR